MSDEEKAIQFYKKFIDTEEQELEWMYKEDEEYYKDDIEQKKLLIKGWKNILNLVTKLQEEIEQKDKYIKNSEDITTEMKNDINKLLLEIKEKDNKVRQIINRLDNDIFRISKSKEINKWDDYRRCRLKAYRTKTREIKEYIEQEYFKKTLKENK